MLPPLNQLSLTDELFDSGTDSVLDWMVMSSTNFRTSKGHYLSKYLLSCTQPGQSPKCTFCY